MFSKTFTALFALLTLSAVHAVPQLERRSDCESSSGNITCCNGYQTPSEAANDPETVKSLNILGIDVTDLTAGIGQGCSPLTVGVTGAPFCSNSQLCCSGVSGTIVIGCTIIQL